MDDLQSERERQLDRLWLHKEHTRREFLDSNLSEFGEAVFLNGCWVFRHKVPFTRGSDESELGLSRKALSEVGQLERLKLIDEAVERKNAAFQEEVSRRHIEIDEFFRELNTRWRRVMDAWLAEEGANTHLNPQLANTRRIVRVNDLLSHEGEKPKVIIKSLLSKTWIALLAGASKSNKSWLALQLAIAVSKGEEWLGFQCHPRRVLYIDYELSLHSLKGRLKKLGLSREVPNQGPDFLILKGGHYKMK